MKKTYAIAIDGPAGAGKSTLARQLAAALGFRYVDTGAIYRTVAYHMALMGIGPKDTDGVTRLLDDVNLDIRYDGAGVQHMILNGADVTDEIRTPEMSQAASLISAQKVVREFLLDVQRALARKNNVIMDGRDIGTVVLPQADVKIFLTASAEVRAQRRCLELEQRGTPKPYDEVLHELNERDYNDSHRAAAPLRAAEDAMVVDTSALDFDASAARPDPGEAAMNHVFFGIIWVLAQILRLLYRIEVKGLENLPRNGVLLCPNHASDLDPVLIGICLPINYRLHFMAKEELFQNRLFGRILRALGAFPVNREGADIQAVKTAMKVIHEGENLLIFPEGTTIHDGVGYHDGLPAHAHSGIAMIGVRSGATLVPVFADGKKRMFRKTTIIFGEPYVPQITGRRGTSEELQKVADDVLREAYALGGQAVGGAPLCGSFLLRPQASATAWSARSRSRTKRPRRMAARCSGALSTTPMSSRSWSARGCV